MTPSRPAEGTQAIISGILGAILIIIGAFRDGIQVDDLNEEVIGALTILVGFVASAVTWYTARRQREGELTSAPDGTVQG